MCGAVPLGAIVYHSGSRGIASRDSSGVASGSAMVPSASASAATGGPATAVAVPAGRPPSELARDESVWRRFLSDLPPLIMRCTIVAASVGVIVEALPIGMFRLKTGGPVAVLSMTLDDAPGVSVTCAVPSPQERLREGERRCRSVRCLRRLRDLSRGGTCGFSGSYKAWPSADKKHSLHFFLSLKFYNLQRRQRQKNRLSCA